MTVTPEIYPDAVALGAAAAELIAERIARARGRRFLLGCPGGRSAGTTYAALADQVATRDLDLSHLVIVMMDDYLIPDGSGGFRRESPTAPHSCERFGREEIVAVLNRGLNPGRRVPPENLWLPEPVEPGSYDDRIGDAGGIDVFLLASGASDGHVAFNPQGSPADSTTRIVELPDSTRRDNLATFPTFADDLANVPTHGVTVGIGTIRDHSHEVIMLVHGPDKALAVERLRSARGYDPTWPASVYASCQHPHLFIDDHAIATRTVNWA